MKTFIIEGTATVSFDCYVEAETIEDAKKRFFESPDNQIDFCERDFFDAKIITVINPDNDN